MADPYTPDRVFLVGAPRTGKSTNMRRLLGETLARRRAAGVRSRLVLFDPMREYWPEGATRVKARTCERNTPTCRLSPPCAAHALKSSLAAEAATGTFTPIVVEEVYPDWSPFDQVYDLVLAGDEVHNFTEKGCHPSLRRLVCQSGHFRTDVLLSTQRPNHLTPTVRMAVSRGVLLPLRDHRDRAAVEESLSITLPAAGAWPRVPGAPDDAQYRAPLIWPDDFDDEGKVRARPAPTV